MINKYYYNLFFMKNIWKCEMEREKQVELT